jgi:hypothetical protein
MHKFKQGDRIRQTRVYEGVVQKDGVTFIAEDGTTRFIELSGDLLYENELLEEYYEVGSYWMDATNFVWRRTADEVGPWKPANGSAGGYFENVPQRPLTRVYLDD